MLDLLSVKLPLSLDKRTTEWGAMGTREIGKKQVIYLLKFAKYFLKMRNFCIFKILSTH